MFYAANKADSPNVDAEAFELYRLGVDKVYPVSALHGRGIGDLEVGGRSRRSPRPSAEPADDGRGPPRIALIGRPNAGKSSLLNRVLGEDRVLVDARPGTTRDAIDALVERGDKRYVFIDTAGIRRKAKVAKEGSAVESLSVLSAIRAIERAHVVVMLCDAAEGVAEQDAKILGLAEERGRAMVLALNKSDLLDKKGFAKAEENAREKLSFIPYVPVVRISAKTGRGVPELFETIDRVRESFYKRVATGELNRFFETVLDTHPPPTMGGRAPRLYYVTQAEVGAAHVRRHDERARLDSLLVPAVRAQPAPQALRVRGGAGARALQGEAEERRVAGGRSGAPVAYAPEACVAPTCSPSSWRSWLLVAVRQGARARGFREATPADWTERAPAAAAGAAAAAPGRAAGAAAAAAAPAAAAAEAAAAGAAAARAAAGAAAAGAPGRLGSSSGGGSGGSSGGSSGGGSGSSSGGVCMPFCGSAVCGDDGCGGSCGTCPSGYTCVVNGTCQENPGSVCGNATCGDAASCCHCNGQPICYALQPGTTCADLGSGCM